MEDVQSRPRAGHANGEVSRDSIRFWLAILQYSFIYQ